MNLKTNNKEIEKNSAKIIVAQRHVSSYWVANVMKNMKLISEEIDDKRLQEVIKVMIKSFNNSHNIEVVRKTALITSVFQLRFILFYLKQNIESEKLFQEYFDHLLSLLLFSVYEKESNDPTYAKNLLERYSDSDVSASNFRFSNDLTETLIGNQQPVNAQMSILIASMIDGLENETYYKMAELMGDEKKMKYYQNQLDEIYAK